MRAFLAIWFGQSISLLGTAMTRFAVALWAWEVTGEATALALVIFFSFGASVIFGPVAGSIVDRYSRKASMIAGDVTAGLVTIGLTILYYTDQLQIWHFYAAGVITGVAESFQLPAYGAAITMMVPKQHYARIGALQTASRSLADVVAPALAGVLLTRLSLGEIMLIDIGTFMIAVSILILVHIPPPTITSVGQESRGSLWSESVYGFRYIFQRPSLFGLQSIFLVNGFLGGATHAALPVLVLISTSNNQVVLGSVQSMAGFGGLIGALLISLWGGFQRKIHGVLIGWILAGGSKILMGVGQIATVWGAAAFLNTFFVPLINGSNQAIWQSKVAPDVQGRVFAVRILIAKIGAVISILLGGILLDGLFLSPEFLATNFMKRLGEEPGIGISLLFMIAGVLMVVTTLCGYLFKPIREVEMIISDHS